MRTGSDEQMERISLDFWAASRVPMFAEFAKRAIFWKDSEKARYWAEKAAHTARFSCPELAVDPADRWAGVRYGQQIQLQQEAA
jgi:hypothetical protein